MIMTEKLDEYILDVQIDNETGEEHCTVLKTDGTTNMANWTEIVSAMYTHHSILKSLVDELNKIQNNYNNTEKYAIKLWEENKQLYELINFANTLIALKTSESCQKEWEKKLKELKE